jgi:hypothetical protein
LRTPRRGSLPLAAGEIKDDIGERSLVSVVLLDQPSPILQRPGPKSTTKPRKVAQQRGFATPAAALEGNPATIGSDEMLHRVFVSIVRHRPASQC